jgi:y4mF family transcriptional regulator
MTYNIKSIPIRTIMKITTAKELGLLVHTARKSAKLTQADLAAAAGLGERFVRELERGKPTCQLEKALLIIRMLGIQLHATLPPPINE